LATARHRARVLVVDDDEALRELLRTDLTDRGYAVETVAHGAAALEILKRQEPNVIVVDLKMPIMDGWSFVEQLRRNSAGRPLPAIILLTATRDGEASAKRLAVDAYLLKPFDLDDLASAIGRCLAQS
jgi:two-component system, chemotaxis family, chemotaxis protein CheY